MNNKKMMEPDLKYCLHGLTADLISLTAWMRETRDCPSWLSLQLDSLSQRAGYCHELVRKKEEKEG